MVNVREKKNLRFLREGAKRETSVSRAKKRILATQEKERKTKKAQDKLARNYTSKGYTVKRDSKGNPRQAIKDINASRTEKILLDDKGRVQRVIRDKKRGAVTRTEYSLNYNYDRGEAIERFEDSDGELEKKQYYKLDSQGNKYKYKEKKYDSDGKLRRTVFFNPNTGRKIGAESEVSKPTKRELLASRTKQLQKEGLDRGTASKLANAELKGQKVTNLDADLVKNVIDGKVKTSAVKIEELKKVAVTSAVNKELEKRIKEAEKSTNVEKPTYIELGIALKRLENRGITNPTKDEFNAQLAQVQRTGYSINEGKNQIQVSYNPQTERSTFISKGKKVTKEQAKELVKQIDFQNRVSITQELFKLANEFKNPENIKVRNAYGNYFNQIKNIASKTTGVKLTPSKTSINIPNLAKSLEAYSVLVQRQIQVIERKQNKTKADRDFLLNAGLFLTGIVSGAGSSARVIRNFNETVNYLSETLEGKRNVISDIKVAGKSFTQAFKTDPFLTSGSVVGAILGTIVTYKIGAKAINFTGSRLGAFAIKNAKLVKTKNLPKKTTAYSKGSIIRNRAGDFGIVGVGGKVVVIPEKITLGVLKSISKALQLGFDPLYEIPKQSIQAIGKIASFTGRTLDSGTRRVLSKVIVGVDRLPAKVTKGIGYAPSVSAKGVPNVVSLGNIPKSKILIDKNGQIGIISKKGNVIQLNNPSLSFTKGKALFRKLFPEPLAIAKSGEDVKFTTKVKSLDGKKSRLIELNIVSKMPKQSLQKQLSLGGKTLKVAVTTQGNELVKFIRTSLTGAGRKRRIAKPLPLAEGKKLSKATQKMLDDFLKGKKMTNAELLQLDRRIAKEGGRGLIETSLFLDPSGNIRPSRGLLGESASDLAKELLPDIGLGSFSAKNKPQILVFLDLPVGKYPKYLQPTIKKLRRGGSANASDLKLILRYQQTKEGISKGLGKIKEGGTLTGEAEVTIPAGEIIQYRQKLGFIKFQGKKIPVVLADIYKPNKTEKALLNKYKKGTATKKELVELNTRLKRNTGIDYKFQKSKINKNKNVSYRRTNKRFLSAKDLISKVAVSSARKTKASSKKKTSASKRKTASRKKRTSTSRKKSTSRRKGSSGKRSGTSKGTSGSSPKRPKSPRQPRRPKSPKRPKSPRQPRRPKSPKRPKTPKVPPSKKITFNTKLPRGFEFIVDGKIKKGNRIRTIRLRTTPNRARRNLQKLVDRKIIASYDIIAVGAKKIKDIKPPKSKKFRLKRGADPKVRKYVEKAKYRIDTKQEKRALQKARRKARKTRKKSKSIKKKATKKKLVKKNGRKTKRKKT